MCLKLVCFNHLNEHLTLIVLYETDPYIIESFIKSNKAQLCCTLFAQYIFVN